MTFFIIFSLALAAAALHGTDASLLPAGNATLFPPSSSSAGGSRKLIVEDHTNVFGFVVSQIRESTAWCLVAADGVSNGAKLKLQLCDFDTAPPEQLWKFDADGKLHTKLDETKCMVANYGTSFFNGVRMRINDCNLETDLNTFTLNVGTTDYLTVDAAPSYCITNRGPSPHSTDTMHAKPCLDRKDYKWTFQPLPSTQHLLSYQQTPGVCGRAFPGIGCSNDDGTIGNPNDLVNCFVAPYTPFDVTHVKFWLNDFLPSLPTSLSVRVWSGTVAGGPSELVSDQPLTTITTNLNDVALVPVTMTDGEFCIGVHGGDENEGFRLDVENNFDDVSFLMAPECGVSSFISLTSLPHDRFFSFCIEVMVEPVMV